MKRTDSVHRWRSENLKDSRREGGSVSTWLKRILFWVSINKLWVLWIGFIYNSESFLCTAACPQLKTWSYCCGPGSDGSKERTHALSLQELRPRAQGLSFPHSRHPEPSAWGTNLQLRRGTDHILYLSTLTLRSLVTKGIHFKHLFDINVTIPIPFTS